MPYFIRKEVLIEARIALGWPMATAAEKAGIDRGTLAALESGRRLVCKAVTLETLATLYRMAPTTLAEWKSEADARGMRLAEDVEPDLGPHERVVRTAGRARHATVPPRRATVPYEPRLVIGLVNGERIPLVGESLLHRFLHAGEIHVNERFAVQGVVTDTARLSPVSIGKVEGPKGATIRCTLVRTIDQRHIGVTVVSRHPSHTRQLLDASDDAALVTAVVRVVLSSEDGSCPGFRPAPNSNGKRVPFALVVESLPREVSLHYEASGNLSTGLPQNSSTEATGV